MPTYAITGASGQLGRIATQELLDRGVAPSDLVLITRSPDGLDSPATVRHGDFTQPDTLAEAFADVDRLLLISTDAVGTRLDHQRAAIAAAQAAGVERIVYTSAPNPVADNPAGVNPDHRGTEEALQASGLTYTILRNALYAEFQIPDVQHAIASGQFFTNTGDGRTSYVSRDDCAAAAAGALISDDVDNAILDITGTELLTAADRAALAADLGDRSVEVVQLDDEAYTAGLVDAGIPAEGAGLIASFGTAIREGYLDQLSDAVERLAGRPPKSLREVVSQ